MKTVGLGFIVLFFAIIPAGWSREDQRAADTGAEGKPQSGGTPTAGDRTRSWTYVSKDFDFSLDLPSAGWKQLTKKRFIADFWCPGIVGSPMLAGVTSVKKQTEKQFRASIPPFRAHVEKRPDYLAKPTIQEGKTDSGNPYVFAAMCEKGKADTQFIYVATAAVWLADKGITVTTLFEGQGKMKSRVFKSIEVSEFEAVARSICLSPR